MVDCPETAISCTSRVLSNICPDDTDAEQLGTVHCTSAQQSGSESRSSGCRPPAEKRCRAEETTEEHAAQLQSYHSFLHNSFAREACLMCYAYA